MALEDKITAVVLAGGKKKFPFKEIYYQLEHLWYYREWSYGESNFMRGYKSLKPTRRKIDGVEKQKPMVEYILNTLSKVESIDNILVVGPKKEIKEKVDPELLENDKIQIVQQTESYGGNVKKGYELTGKEYVLYVVADSPTTRENDVIEFLDICEKLYGQYDIIYPMVKESLHRKHKKLPRKLYFRMMPDNMIPSNYIEKSEIDEKGWVGFKATSMAFVRLEGVPRDRIDEAYKLRKFYLPSTWRGLRRIFGKGIIKKYWKGLYKMSEIEKMFLDYEGKTIKIVGLRGAGTSLDFDGTSDNGMIKNLQNLCVVNIQMSIPSYKNVTFI